MINAKQQQYRTDSLTRKGDGGIAEFLDEGRKSATQERVNEIRMEHPDLPSDNMYDLHSVVESGLWRDSDGTEDSFSFIPDEGYKYDPIGMKYDVNSKTFQHDGSFPRMARKGMALGYSHLLDMATAPLASMMSGMYEEGKEGARSDLQRVWTPDYFSKARTNPEQTFAAYGEAMGAALIGFGVDWFGGKQVLRSKGQTAPAKIANAIDPKKWKSFISNFSTRLEQETAPSLIFAEFINAADPLNDINAGPAVGHWLENNGMTGYLVDYLKESQDDKFSKGITNVVLGTMMMEVMRGAGTAGLRLGGWAYTNAAEFVQTAFKNAFEESKALEKLVQTAIESGGGK